MAGSKDDKAIGETFHLVDPDPISSGEVFTLLSELYANKKPAYTVPARPVALALRAKPVQKLFEGIPAESIQYLNHPVRYDARRAADLLERSGLRLPRFPEKTASAQHQSANSPMPGQVLRILVAEGQQVKPGDGLIVLEAMKMEQTIKATIQGVVRTILVKAAQVVAPGEMLVEIESVEDANEHASSSAAKH